MSTEQQPSTDGFVPNTPTPATPTPTASAGAQPVINQGKSTSVMAVLGLVFAFLAPLLGLIFSIIGMNQTKNNKQGGRGLAVAGLIVSIIGMIIGLAWIVLFIVAAVTADPVEPSYTYDSSSLSSSLTDEQSVVAGTVGSPVSAENFDLTVKSVQRNYVPTDEYYVPTDGKEYVLVSVELKNTGSTSENYSDYDFKLRDTAGVEEGTTYVSGIASPLDYGSLAGGGTVSGNLIFEVKKGDALTLVYTPSYFAREIAEVKL